MQRAILGYLALALLAASLPMLLFNPVSVFGGAMLRVGLVLGAMWLAIPNVKILFTHVPPWLIAATFVGVILLAYNFKATFMFVVPTLAVLWVLVPSWFQKQKK